MAAIMQNDIFKFIFLCEIYWIPVALKFKEERRDGAAAGNSSAAVATLPAAGFQRH